MILNRRNFLRIGGSGVALGALSPLFRCPFLSRPLQAAMMGVASPKKMLVIFLRGGMDGLNVIIPRGDDEYNDTVDSRPTLFIAPDDALDLPEGTTFAQANPGLARLVEDVPQESVAYIHRVGYTPSIFSRSHFEGQQYWENAVPGDGDLEDGWVNRLGRYSDDIQGVDFRGASVSYNLQVLFRGAEPMAHIPDLGTYTLGDAPIDSKLLGVAPNGDSGSGLLGVYSRPADSLAYDELVRGHGIALAASLDAIAQAEVDPTTYVPAGAATYPTAGSPGDFPGDFGAFTFFRQLRHSVQLLKETECRIAGIQLDGFDTHSTQGPQLERLLRILAHGIWAAYEDTATSIWSDLVVVTLSEFGRTSQENGSFGTDHAEASCMFVAGGGVAGGVYNCDSTTWPNGTMFSTPSFNPRYLSQRTDFRAILAEIVDKHFAAGNVLDDVIPNWSTSTGSSFDYLNFLK